MAISSTTAWEVRIDGDDTNGGGFNASGSGAGTDLTYPTPAVYTYTDIAVATATGTPVLTSSARPFVAADVRNIINLTSGTNLTAGRYEIVSVSSGAATLDRACGSAASLTAINGKLGGALLSPAIASSVAVGGNTIHIKKGASAFLVTSSSSNVVGGRMTITSGVSAAFPTRVSGYKITRGDRPALGDRPQIASDGVTGGSASAFLSPSTNTLIENLSITAAAWTAGMGTWSGINGTLSTTVRDCDISSFGSSGRFGITAGKIERCYVELCQNGIVGSVRTEASDCTLKNCGIFFAANTSQIRSVVERCLIIRNTTTFAAGGACQVTGTSDGSISYIGCRLYGAYFSLTASTGALAATVQDCVQYGSAGYGVDSALVDPISSVTFRNNSFGGNTSGNFNGVLPTSGVNQMLFNNTTLTADPYVDSANLNFAINNASGGGALVQQNGTYTYPGTLTTVKPNGSSSRRAAGTAQISI